MAEVIRMPRLSDTMEEGVIVAWHKKVGDSVAVGDILAEVETDKATMDLESFNEGTLLHIGVEEGAVPVDGIIAVIGDKGEDVKAILAEAEKEQPASGGSSEPASERTPAGPNGKEESPTEQAATPAPATAQTADGGRIKASPLARAIAQESGIDLRTVEGTGDNGRIVKRDVDAALKGDGLRKPASPAVEQLPSSGHKDIPLSQMRKTIARRLAESKFSAPHFYLTMEIDMTEAVAARKAINDNAEVRVSFNDMIVKACAMALKAHPDVNASWLGDKIRQHYDVHIGVAVAIDDGLLVPVVRHADRKGLRQLHNEIVEFAGRAQQKRLQPEEMQGNTFTISNLGMFGIEEFTAILNPPESCILAVGTITERPVIANGEIMSAHMMRVTMSCDHRVVDGAMGARFLQTVKDLLEHPVKMLA